MIYILLIYNMSIQIKDLFKVDNVLDMKVRNINVINEGNVDVVDVFLFINFLEEKKD